MKALLLKYFLKIVLSHNQCLPPTHKMRSVKGHLPLNDNFQYFFHAPNTRGHVSSCFLPLLWVVRISRNSTANSLRRGWVLTTNEPQCGVVRQCLAISGNVCSCSVIKFGPHSIVLRLSLCNGQQRSIIFVKHVNMRGAKCLHKQ